MEGGRAMNLLKYHLGRMLGWSGLVGVCLWAMCLALFVSLVQPARARLEEMRQRTDTLQVRMERASRTLHSNTQSAEGQLAEFYRVFPSEQATADLIGQIAGIAQRHGLNLEQGEYKATPDKLGKLTRLQITLPLKGSYQQIRGCLAALGSELPIVALEQAQFERQKVGDALLEAKLRLVLFLGQMS
jgi:Tfp pilus assembly protein PilO